MRCLRFAVASLFFLCSAAARAGDEKGSPWNISGQLEEACSCDAACPCWFESKPTRSRCSGGQVIFIEKGRYGGIALDGLAIGIMGQNPEGTTMMESVGNWDFANIYLDEKANPEQRKALEAIAKATTPSFAPPERTRLQYVPITRKIEGSEHVITIGSVASFSGHLMTGGLGGAPKIVDAPGSDPIHREYLQGRTTRQTYTDSGQKWDWSDTNYMYATFETDSAEYEKFSRAMMQQMEKKKAAKKAN